MKYEIRNSFTGAVQFTAEIGCADDTPKPHKKRLAVLWAVENGADLRGASLRDADLSDANLIGANLRDADLRGASLSGASLSDADLRDANLRGASLSDADLRGTNLRGASLSDADLRGTNLRGARGIDDRIIDGGLRGDGYRFYLTRTEPGEWRIKAGCRNFTLSEATEHWARTRPHGDALGDETRLIINHMIAVAKLRNWPETGEEGE